MDKIINKIYTDPEEPGAFGSADALYEAVHRRHPETSKKQVQHFLEGNRKKWFSESNRLDWIRVLPKFLNAINASRTRSTGMRPQDIDHNNAREVWKRLYGNEKESVPKNSKLLSPGDKVRVAEGKQVFDKGYFPNYSAHIYTINKSHATQPEHYEIKDHDGDVRKRRYYRAELLKTREDAYADIV